MSDNCSNNCSSCGQDCGDRREEQSFLTQTNEYSNIRKVIAVVSGKGGVGKSLVTSLLAAGLQERGKKVGIMDADITGPSIPRAFGIKERAFGTEEGVIPCESEGGVKVMSLNLLMENETDPVVWRGPVIAGAVKQFWTDTLWGDLDYLFVDMPPGTGDVPLTVFQSLPLAGIVVVTSPQELVHMIVAKAVQMANLMHVPVLGLVENMSYLECPDCGKEISVFGESRIAQTAEEFGVETYARMPIDPRIAKACDKGQIETLKQNWLEPLFARIEQV